MNCYAIQNPINGQQCKDDILGSVAYNSADGTWEIPPIIEEYNVLPNLQGTNNNSVSNISKIPTVIVMIIILIIVILLLRYFKIKI